MIAVYGPARRRLWSADPRQSQRAGARPETIEPEKGRQINGLACERDVDRR